MLIKCYSSISILYKHNFFTVEQRSAVLELTLPSSYLHQHNWDEQPYTVKKYDDSVKDNKQLQGQQLTK